MEQKRILKPARVILARAVHDEFITTRNTSQFRSGFGNGGWIGSIPLRKAEN